jgi:hypothetical protein
MKKTGKVLLLSAVFGVAVIPLLPQTAPKAKP